MVSLLKGDLGEAQNIFRPFWKYSFCLSWNNRGYHHLHTTGSKGVLETKLPETEAVFLGVMGIPCRYYRDPCPPSHCALFPGHMTFPQCTQTGLPCPLVWLWVGGTVRKMKESLGIYSLAHSSPRHILVTLASLHQTPLVLLSSSLLQLRLLLGR